MIEDPTLPAVPQSPPCATLDEAITEISTIIDSDKFHTIVASILSKGLEACYTLDFRRNGKGDVEAIFCGRSKSTKKPIRILRGMAI